MSLTPDEERAAALAAKVEQEASAVTDRIERRAEALEEQRAGQAANLEEQRIEHRAEERVEQRSDLRQELHGISEAIGILVEHMDQSLPEERVRQLAEAVLAEERIGRRRLTTKITGFLIVIVLLIISSLLLGAANRNTLTEAKVTSDYVRKCIQHPEKLTPKEKVEKCGSGGDEGTVKLIKGLLKAINCSLLISPEARTEVNTDACAKTAFGG